MLNRIILDRLFIEQAAIMLSEADECSLTSMIVSVNPEIESEEIKKVMAQPGCTGLFVPWIVRLN